MFHCRRSSWMIIVFLAAFVIVHYGSDQVFPKEQPPEPTPSPPPRNINDIDWSLNCDQCKIFLDPQITIGGLNNQRESVINQILFAKEIGFCGIVLQQSCIACGTCYAGHKHRAPKPFDPPYQEYYPHTLTNSICGPFNLLWDEPTFVDHAQSVLGLCVKRKDNTTVFERSKVWHFRNYLDVLGKPNQDWVSYTVEEVHATFRPMYEALDPSVMTRVTNTPGTSLVSSVYTRYAKECSWYNKTCPALLTKALRPNAFIRGLIKQIRDLIKEKFGNRGAYTTVQIRGVWCKMRPMHMQKLASALQRQNVPRLTPVYIVHEFPVNATVFDPLRAAFPNLIAKDSLLTLGKIINLPYEVRAAIDSQVMVESDSCFSTSAWSSLVQFVTNIRVHSGKSKCGFVEYIGCGSKGTAKLRYE
eukprot:PhF_6_TR25599/c0_g1_i1/m.35915